jgi:5'-3' exonuclease
VSSYVRQFVPEDVIFVWDEKKDRQPNIRRSILEKYKQNRSKDLAPHQNNETIKSILLSMGINSIFPRQLEADDIVSYICREHEGEKVIISVDRDFLQLITSSCSLYDPIRKTIFNNINFEERTGFKDVEEWYTAKCLTGDSSDNVPGIPGFGKVTTRKYLNDPGYILTEQEHEIFTRNADIFCLDKYESLPDEKQYYEEQLAVKVESDYKQFIKFCEQFSFTRILDKKTEWHNLFFLKSLYNKLNDLTS